MNMDKKTMWIAAGVAVVAYWLWKAKKQKQAGNSKKTQQSQMLAEQDAAFSSNYAAFSAAPFGVDVNSYAK